MAADLDYQRGQSAPCNTSCYWCRVRRDGDGSSLHKWENPDTLIRDPCDDVFVTRSFYLSCSGLILGLGYKKIQDIFLCQWFNETLIGLIFVTLVILGLIFFLGHRLGSSLFAIRDNNPRWRPKSFGDQHRTDGIDGFGHFKWDYRSFWCTDAFNKKAMGMLHVELVLSRYRPWLCLIIGEVLFQMSP